MMGALNLRPWRPGDEAAFAPRGDLAQDMAANDHDWRRGPPPGMIWAIERPDGRVEGVAGAMFVTQGVVHVWACVADLTPRELARCLGLARRTLQFVANDPTVKSIVADARMEDRGAVRGLERLGFLEDPAGRRVIDGIVYVRMRRAA
jgi:hypothetical protein